VCDLQCIFVVYIVLYYIQWPTSFKTLSINRIRLTYTCVAFTQKQPPLCNKLAYWIIRSSYRRRRRQCSVRERENRSGQNTRKRHETNTIFIGLNIIISLWNNKLWGYDWENDLMTSCRWKYFTSELRT